MEGLINKILIKFCIYGLIGNVVFVMFKVWAFPNSSMLWSLLFGIAFGLFMGKIYMIPAMKKELDKRA